MIYVIYFNIILIYGCCQMNFKHRTIPLVKIFVTIFIRIGTFFKNTKKYSESLYLLSEFFIQVNSKIF